MEKAKFDAVFPIICADLLKKIAAELNLSYKKAITELYSFNLYEILEKEETKLWQYSTEKLFEKFMQERNNGSITFPEVWWIMINAGGLSYEWEHRFYCVLPWKL